MAGLRVFVSSTCYDLSMIRTQLRGFIQSLGYEPIMSDYDEVLYDPRIHTHTSCVDEVGNCDILVLIIGARFGGKASLEALGKIDFEKLRKENKNVDNLKKEANLSVTQLEVLKAIENEIPVYTFIDKKVWHDHELYEKNKNNNIVEQIFFPSIEKQETARYIFEFINFVRTRTRGNNIFSFEKEQEVEEVLKKQWSAYFQRLLYEQRYVKEEKKKMEVLSNQFEDLKTAILSSIENVDQREVARGIVRYRRLFDFLYSIRNLEQKYLKTTQDGWEQLLEKVGIKEIIDPIERGIRYPGRARLLLVCSNDTFYEMRYGREVFDNLGNEWEAYIKLKDKSREIILETLREEYRGVSMVRYIDESVEKYSRRYEEEWQNRQIRQVEIEEIIETGK